MSYKNGILNRKSSIKKIFILYIICLLLVSFFPHIIDNTLASAENEEINCIVSDDSFIKSNEKNMKYGYFGTMAIQKLGSSEMRSLIRFDLPEIPDGSTIVSASLQLIIAGTNNDPTGNRIDCHQILSNWHEDSVTWNSQPSYSGITDYDYVPSSPHMFKWMQWDVTDDINYYYNTNPNYYHGWLLKIAEPTDGGVYFATKEYTTEERRPILSITYELPEGCFKDQESNPQIVIEKLDDGEPYLGQTFQPRVSTISMRH